MSDKDSVELVLHEARSQVVSPIQELSDDRVHVDIDSQLLPDPSLDLPLQILSGEWMATTRIRPQPCEVIPALAPPLQKPTVTLVRQDH